MTTADLRALRASVRLLLHTFAWHQGKRNARYWLPAGKPDAPANRLYGARAEKAAAAARTKREKGTDRPAPAAAGGIDHAGEARRTYERALQNGITGPLLERLRARAEQFAKAPPKIAVPAGGLKLAAPPAPGTAPGTAPAPRPAPPAPAKKAPPMGDPARPAATPEPVLARARSRAVGVGQTSRSGEAVAAQRAGAPAAPAAVPPGPDGTPDFGALKKSVDAGITTSRARHWSYDFGPARAALAEASRQIDGWARANPRKVAPLAREVTGHEPDSTEDGVNLLKAWVGETLALLAGEPSRLDGKRGRSSSFAERVAWLAGVAPRLARARQLLAALAA